MKKFFILVLFGIFFSGALGFSGHVKDHESTIVWGLGRGVDLYKKEKGHLPNSWADVISGSFFDVSLVRDAELRLDYIDKYRFLDSSVDVFLGWRKEKVIVMSVGPIAENFVDEEGGVRYFRWLIVEMPSGDVELRKHTESALERMFSEAGFSLADFTGENGRWEEKIIYGSADVNTGAPSLGNEGIVDFRGQEVDSGKVIQNPDSSRIGVSLFVFVFLCISFILFVVKKWRL